MKHAIIFSFLFAALNSHAALPRGDRELMKLGTSPEVQSLIGELRMNGVEEDKLSAIQEQRVTPQQMAGFIDCLKQEDGFFNKFIGCFVLGPIFR